MKKKRVGIIGAAGYTGGELVRLLLAHDGTDLVAVQSRSQAGRNVSEHFSDLAGETELKFKPSIDEYLNHIDVLFLALPHGESKIYLAGNQIPEQVQIIDLSQDFRVQAQAQFSDRKFVYGLPERYRDEIKNAKNIANPGCFATAIQLSLLPLARRGLLNNVFVTGITGSTGAGVKASATTHFSFRANNIQAYKGLSHQHLAEVEETLTGLQQSNAHASRARGSASQESGSHGSSSDAHAVKINFVPWRGDFTRGIFVTSQLETKLSKKDVLDFFQNDYEDHPFVRVTTDAIDLKSVVNTNRALIEINQEGTTLAIHVAIDNLLKGASGQAVQNYNLMSGFPETLGLKLKGVVY